MAASAGCEAGHQQIGRTTAFAPKRMFSENDLEFSIDKN